jgi:glycosyltransferase involved in cell wall biosynthesis/SAM-dependent methyltransferase
MVSSAGNVGQVVNLRPIVNRPAERKRLARLMTIPKRTRLAIFTPLPPARTGTADYAAALLPELRKLIDVEVYSGEANGFDPRSYDAVLYQIGNNPHHAGAYRAALRFPGVVALHEANVHDLVAGFTQKHHDTYFREVMYEIFGEEIASIPRDGLTRMEPQPRVFTMLRRLLDRSAGCIVHNRFSESEVRMKGYRGPLARIPHGASVRHIDGGAYRNRLGLSDEPLIGIFGYQRPDKRACECLPVFRNLLKDIPGARLLIVGEPHPEVPLTEMVERLGLTENVHLLGHQTLDDFDGYLAACDVVLNLRWPTYGETSGTVMRAFGLAKAVVVSDLAASRDFGDEICVRVPCDDYQNEVLLECLQWLLSDRGITSKIGADAQEWVANTCTWERVAGAYAEFLASYREVGEKRPQVSSGFDDAAALRKSLAQWTPSESALSYLREHETRLVRTLQLIPRGEREDRILEMGCYLQITPLLGKVIGYGEVRGCYLGTGGQDRRMLQSRNGDVFDCEIDLFDAELDSYPYSNGYFSTVLCCELLEHLQRDPMHMMSEIHRVLKPGGIVLLTTPNAVSMRAVAAILRGGHPGFYARYSNPETDGGPRHAREYTPEEVSELLTDSGFVVVHVETGPYCEPAADNREIAKVLARLKQPANLREDCIYAVGRKTAAPRNRYPAWLYEQ